MSTPKPDDSPDPVPSWIWIDDAYECMKALAGHARDMHPKCRGGIKACGICAAIHKAKKLTAPGDVFRTRTSTGS